MDDRLSVLKNFVIDEVDSHTVQQVLGEQQAFQQLFLRTVTEKSEGNANGMGLADFIPRHMYEQIDFGSTYVNTLTDEFMSRCKHKPLVVPFH